MAHTPLQGTESAAKTLQRVRYTHDDMIDMIIANPTISQNELAKTYGFTPAWVSQVINSDAFQARLAVRKEDLVDPSLRLSIDEKLKAVVSRSLDVLSEKLALPQVNADLALKAAEIGAKAMGYGAAKGSGGNTQVNFVVALPQKVTSASEWAATHGPKVIEQEG